MVKHEVKINKDYKEVEECSCCGYGPVMATYVKETDGGADNEGWFCGVCYNSLIGGQASYPDGNNKVLKSMAACTNMILAGQKKMSAKQDKILKLLRDEFYDH